MRVPIKLVLPRGTMFVAKKLADVAVIDGVITGSWRPGITGRFGTAPAALGVTPAGVWPAGVTTVVLAGVPRGPVWRAGTLVEGKMSVRGRPKFVLR